MDRIRRRNRTAPATPWRTRLNVIAAFVVLALVAQYVPVAAVTPAAAAVDTAGVKIFYPDMHSRLGAKILATITTAGAARLKITVTGPSYSAVLADIPSPTAADTHVATLNLRTLAAGTYTVTADVTNSSGVLIGQKVRTFNKPMSGTPRVGFDENNALYVNGQLTPVIGTWWGNYAGSWSPQYLPGLKSAGRITTAEVIDGARSSSTWASALDQSAANGITAIGPTIAGQSDIANIVNTSKGKTALLSWMWIDEPEYAGVAASTVRGWTDQAHALDPNHPVMVNLVGPMFVNQGGSQATARTFTSDLIGAERNGVVDWYSTDYYPIAFSPNFGMTRQAAYDNYTVHLANLRTFTKDLYPLKTFIEVGSMPELNSSTVPRPNEIWAQVWIAITKGVRSISWFPVDSTGSAVIDAGTPAMEAKAVSYLNRYAPMLAQADSKKVSRTHTAGSGRIDYTAKEYNGKLYVFAVNHDVASSGTARFDLTGFTASSVTVYDENRTVALSGSSFTDSFVPYGVHIYEIAGAASVPAAPTGTMTVNNGAAITDSTAVTVNSSVTGAAEMRIDPGTGTFGAWTAYAASQPISLPAGDGLKTVRAEYRNAGGTLARSATITLQTPQAPPTVTAPTGTMSLDGGAAFTNSSIVTVTSNVTGATLMRFDTGTGYGAWTAYASVYPVGLPAGDGAKTVSAQYQNAGGTLTVSDSITLDTAAPTGWFTVNHGAPQTTSRIVEVQNYVTGATRMRVGTGGSYGDWAPYAGTLPVTLPDGGGTKAVAMQYADDAGNVHDQATTITLVTVSAPVGSTSINRGAKATNSTTVTVDCAVTGATQMRFDNGTGYGAWRSYAASSPLTLPSGDGTKTVTAQYQNAAGTLTDSCAIVLDTAAPTGWFTINHGATKTTSQRVSIQNNVVGAERMRFATGGGYSEWTTYSPTTTLVLPAGDGTKYVVAQYADAAGNVLDQATSILLKVAKPRTVSKTLVRSTRVRITY